MIGRPPLISNERPSPWGARGRPMCTTSRTRWAAPFQFSNDASHDTAKRLPSVNEISRNDLALHAFKRMRGGVQGVGSSIQESGQYVHG